MYVTGDHYETKTEDEIKSDFKKQEKYNAYFLCGSI